MLELQSLKFAVETGELDVAVTKLDAVGKAVQNLNRIQTKATADQKSASDSATKADQAVVDSARQVIKANEDKAKSGTSANKGLTDSTDRLVALMQKESETLGFMTREYSKGQSSLLAYAKALGATEEQLKDLGKTLDAQRALQGNNPFDKSLGALKVLKNELQITKEAQRLYNVETGLTAIQTKDLARDKLRLIEIAKAETGSIFAAREAIRSVQTEYIRQAGTLNSLTTSQRNHDQALVSSAKAQEFISREMQRVAFGASNVNSELTKTTANGLFKFEQMLRRSGLSIEDQRAKLEAYKKDLMSFNKAQSGLQGQDKVNYVTRAVGPQITDIFVGLSTGQSPLTVMLQQGGQLRDQFALAGVAAGDMAKLMRTAASDMVVSIKAVSTAMVTLVFGALKDGAVGLGNMAMSATGVNYALGILTKNAQSFEAMLAGIGVNSSIATKAISFLGSAIRGLMATGLLLLVTTLIAVGVEMYKVMTASTDLAQAAARTGATLGYSQEMFVSLAKSMQDTGRSTSDIIRVFAEISKAGVFTSAQLEAIARSAILMNKYVDVAVKDTVASFKSMKEDPVKALGELAASTGLVSQAVYAQVVSLNLQGKTIAAATLAVQELDKVNQSIAARAKANMSPLEQGWIDVKERIVSSTHSVMAFLETGAKLGIMTQWSNLTTIFDAVSGAIAKTSSILSDLQAKLKEPISAADFWGNFVETVKAINPMELANLGWEMGKKMGNGFAKGAKEPDQVFGQNSVRKSDASQGAVDTAEMNARAARQAAVSAYWTSVETEGLTELQKAVRKLIEVKGRLAEQKNAGLLSDRDEQIGVRNLAAAYREYAEAKLNIAKRGLPTIGEISKAEWQLAISLNNKEIELVKNKEKEKLDELKASYDSDVITFGQYISRKQAILQTDGAVQMQLMKNQFQAESDGYESVRKKIEETSAARLAAVQINGRDPLKVAEDVKHEVAETKKALDDLDKAHLEAMTNISNSMNLLDMRVYVDMRQALAEYQKQIKDVTKAIDEYVLFEKKRNDEVQRNNALEHELLWATPEQAARIKAMADATKDYAGKIALAGEAARKAKKDLDSLVQDDGTGGIIGNPDDPVYRAAFELWRVRVKQLNEEIAGQRVAVENAGSDAIVKYYDQERKKLVDGLTDSIVTALFEGGKAGSKKLRDLIIAELKKPVTIVVQAIVGSILGGGSGGAAGIGLNAIINKGVSSVLGGIGNFLGNLGGTAGGAAVDAIGGLETAVAVGETTAGIAAPTSLLGAMTAAWSAGSAAFASGAGLLESFGAGLAAMGPVGWAALAAAAVITALGLSKDELGIKIDNSVRDGTGRKDIINSALGQFDVSGDIPNSAFDALIKRVQDMDKYIADNLLTDDQLAAVKERIQAISSDMTDWFGFSDEAGAKEAIGKASKLFLQQRYSAVFDEINATVAEQIRAFKGTADELLTFLTDTFNVLAAIQNSMPTLQNIFGEVIKIDDILALQQEGETLGAAFQRLVAEFNVTNTAASLMGKTAEQAFGAVGLASTDARERLISYAGGIDKLTSSLNFYLENFFTEEERRRLSTKAATDALTSGFAALDLAVPTSRAGFRALVDSIDISTKEGARLYAALMALAPAMAAVTAAVPDSTILHPSGNPGDAASAPSAVMSEIRLLAGMAADSIKSLFTTVLSEATSAEDARIKGTEAAGKMFLDSMMSMMLDKISAMIVSSIIEPMSTGLLNAIDTAGVQAVARSLESGDIMKAAALTSGTVAVDASAVAAMNTTGASAVAGTNLVVGGTTAGTNVAVGGVFAGDAIAAAVDQIVQTINLMSAVMSSPEFQAAYSTFTAAMGTFSAALYVAQGTIPHPVSNTNNNNSSSSTSVGNAAQDAYNLLVAAINKQKELASAQLKLVTELYDITVSAIKSLKDDIEGTQGASYKAARAFITQASADIANGLLPDVTKYKDAVDASVAGVKGATYATLADEQKAKALLAVELQHIADTLGPQKTALERQLEYLDGLLTTAKAQLDAISGNTVAVLTLAQAIQNWANITGNVLPVIPMAPVPSATGSTGNFVAVNDRSYDLTRSASVSSANSANYSEGDSGELTMIREQLELLRAEVRADVSANSKTAKILQRVSQDSDSLRTSAA